MDNLEGDEGYLERRIRQRNEQNESLAEQMLKDSGLVVCGEVENVSDPVTFKEGVELAPIPKCAICSGRGWVKTLFSRADCFMCDGTGYDLSNPMAIIHHQRALLAWAKAELIKARKEAAEALDTRTEQQKKDDAMCKAIDNTYKNSKYRRHD